MRRKEVRHLSKTDRCVDHCDEMDPAELLEIVIITFIVLFVRQDLSAIANEWVPQRQISSLCGERGRAGTLGGMTASSPRRCFFFLLVDRLACLRGTGME